MMHNAHRSQKLLEHSPLALVDHNCHRKVAEQVWGIDLWVQGWGVDIA